MKGSLDQAKPASRPRNPPPPLTLLPQPPPQTASPTRAPITFSLPSTHRRLHSLPSPQRHQSLSSPDFGLLKTGFFNKNIKTPDLPPITQEKAIGHGFLKDDMLTQANKRHPC
ncbi:hypothetical protein BLNAU_13749 [Blattamonas nauphoetae]|uniref:Uncharacterized protein n=1 Tax=Blattamonas nauphoetae TaxID=2049346 RepID=A0ABQ9XFL4_9EUKA|nr:hypothetical protein BLNAU_13749 [Blattamonas nauphoetae]